MIAGFGFVITASAFFLGPGRLLAEIDLFGSDTAFNGGYLCRRATEFAPRVRCGLS
jgi:hypothetical protein